MLRTLWQRTETFAFVTVVAVLIWLYAEGESVVREKNVEALIQFTAPPNRRLVIEPDEPQTVKLTFSCASSVRDHAVQLIRRGPIRIELTDDPTSLRQTIELGRHLTTLTNLGIILEEVQPSSVEIYVERLVERTLPIVVVPGDAALKGQAIVNPTEANIWMPSHLANGGDLKLEARLRSLNLKAFPENQESTAEVPLVAPWAPENPHVTITPRTAQVTFTIRSQIDTFTVERVPILLRTVPTVLEEYSVTLDPAHRILTDVRLTGPSAAIDLIRQNKFPVEAELRLTPDDVDNHITSKQPYVNVPPGVEPEALPPVPITITRRQPVETIAPAPPAVRAP